MMMTMMIKGVQDDDDRDGNHDNNESEAITEIENGTLGNGNYDAAFIIFVRCSFSKPSQWLLS